MRFPRVLKVLSLTWENAHSKTNPPAIAIAPVPPCACKNRLVPDQAPKSPKIPFANDIHTDLFHLINDVPYFLKERGLTLSKEKTMVTHITEGFDFLGWNVRKYDGKLLIMPSKANIKAHRKKVREIIKANKTAKQVSLIRMLNPVLRGWANYHRHVVAKDAFARNDSQIWSIQWEWATRRHPKKGKRWVNNRYCKTRGSRNWVFAATEEATGKEIQLISEADTPIKRHVKIKMKANPHDPVWREYFNARYKQMKQSTPMYNRMPKGALGKA